MFTDYIFTPELYKVYTGIRRNDNYIQLWQEKIADKILMTSYIFTRIATYCSPALLFMYGKCFLNPEFINQVFFHGSIAGITLITTFLLRSYGRAINPKYKVFYQDLKNAQLEYSTNNKKNLHKYDFDFSSWPVDFSWPINEEKTYRKNLMSYNFKLALQLLSSPSRLIGFIALHTFGISLIYPGSTSFLFYLMHQNLQSGRRSLITTFGGIRYKLKTIDGNFIDSMFVDRRPMHINPLNSKLIICTEGNAGFYEAGIMSSAVETHHSVLGWNHPGFGHSTGIPYIKQEQNAAETVMEFAIKILKFSPQNIILYGWSIGGFASSYLAKQFPDVHAVILDATFDDLVPLAIPRMPSIVENLVILCVREFTNLHVAENINQYHGPVLLIRRSNDEIIAIDPQNVSSNRGNHLLESLLENRYPKLFTEESRLVLWNWLSTSGEQQKQLLNQYGVDSKEQTNSFPSVTGNHPSNLGDGWSDQNKINMLLYLANRYMKDFNSTHCTPLPVEYFRYLI
ncbi:Alpha/beta hydrolase fold-1,Alpha/Beta hydrolase fold [Cinara cedri]|uniref:Alpha/beta hydrolase fold-1,Alpha/Beta hydrolase fold n=1 Tax=Cinara cedri TaxID=506608 RepID=A0A5E4MBB8_9HEMI|nr:Alpha/beta hydrolase fold-1,Alpha/Beta hydrolase fold [Cinara cedri]